MKFPSEVIVTDQKVVLNLSHKEEERITALVEKIVEHIKTSESARPIISIAGISGSGKSTLSEILVALLPQVLSGWSVYHLTIDAFHFTNDEFDARGLRDVKGRWDTYDTASLADTLKKFSKDEEVSFPGYSRITHDPVPNQTHINTQEKSILILEGLWMLFDKGGWDEVVKHANLSYFLESNVADAKARTVARHIRGGRTEKDATTFYENSDAQNNELVLLTKTKAGKIISIRD